MLSCMLVRVDVDVEVLAPVSVRAVAFESKVDAGFGLVFVGKVWFFAYFLVVMGECALNELWFTLCP